MMSDDMIPIVYSWVYTIGIGCGGFNFITDDYIDMPQILFDPPQEGGRRQQVGGLLEGEKRSEYVELCKQMTSRNPGLDYHAIHDRILEILEEDVREYIDTLPTHDRDALLKDFVIILSGIPKRNDDTEPLTTINIVSLQISLLFTRYEYTKNKQEEYFFNSYYTYEILLGNEQLDIYNRKSETYEYVEMEKGDWKDYSYIKKILSNFNNRTDVDLYHLENPDAPKYIFMMFLGFLKLDEIIESYLNNVFYLGLSYKTEWVDGSLTYPLAYLTHDIAHYERYTLECQDFPKIISKFKEFREYLKKHDKKIRYSIDFALFIFLHEHIYCGAFREDNIENELQNKASIESINNLLKENTMDELTDLNNLGMAIPPSYRVLEEGSETKLNEEKVKEYLLLVAERYVAAWNEFRVASNAASGGRRKARRTKRQRRKRATRKARK
jgi:hypothetical protein